MEPLTLIEVNMTFVTHVKQRDSALFQYKALHYVKLETSGSHRHVIVELQNRVVVTLEYSRQSLWFFMVATNSKTICDNI